MSGLDRTEPIRPVFERERCPFNAAQIDDERKSESERRREAMQAEDKRKADRGSYMIKRQQPKPVLRPGRTLSNEPDREKFNAELKADDGRTRNNNQKALYKARHQLLQERKNLGIEKSNLAKASAHDRMGQTKEAMAELYRIRRSTNSIEQRCRKHFSKAMHHSK